MWKRRQGNSRDSSDTPVMVYKMIEDLENGKKVSYKSNSLNVFQIELMFRNAGFFVTARMTTQGVFKLSLL